VHYATSNFLIYTGHLEIYEATMGCVCGYDQRHEECTPNFGRKFLEYIHIGKREDGKITLLLDEIVRTAYYCGLWH
jgi:hypothetical protein